MLDKIKGAIFDMDGTLVDSLGLWDLMWEDFGKRYLGVDGFRPSAEADKAVRTMTLKDAMEMVHALCGLGESGEALTAAAHNFIREYYKTTVQLKPGVLEFLEACQSRGIRLCIASANGPKLLQTAIDCCGIGAFFPQTFSCATIGKGKDRPDIYQMAQEYLGTATEETCVFEDSAVAIETAHKLGMKTVAIYDRYNYGQEQMKAMADAYIADGETLMRLV
ncbi:MAG: HAD family phosphatase [Oscillospiraceae bacterium]|nr:HAD family phosphatase [Oscillospiraceae bacterium]